MMAAWFSQQPAKGQLLQIIPFFGKKKGRIIRPTGLTRLDDARGTNQVWSPHVRTRGLLEVAVLN